MVKEPNESVDDHVESSECNPPTSRLPRCVYSISMYPADGGAQCFFFSNTTEFSGSTSNQRLEGGVVSAGKTFYPTATIVKV